MQRKLKRFLIIVAVCLATITLLLVSAGGWFWWRFLAASRDSLIEKSVTLSADITHHLELKPKRHLKRDKILIEFTLKQKCSSVDLGDRSTNKIDFPDGTSIFLEARCVDTDGMKHDLYIEGYAPTRLFWVFPEAVSKKTKFKSLEITASGKHTLVDIVWIDCHPM